MEIIETALEGIVATVVFEDKAEASADDVSDITTTCYGRLGLADEAATAEVE